jgi:2-dehydropantoate 2-reductase
MRILVVGAGGIGGYFGGRLLDAGRDVTFLVRPRRAAELARTGLVIRSVLGDVHRAAPPTVTADALRNPFDLVLLSCKAYDLEGAVNDLAPAVGSETAIIPLLNGMHHLNVLDARFGAEQVLGGQCFISAALGENGEILHLNAAHLLSFGERDGSRRARTEQIASALSGASFEARLSGAIVQEMWEKWVFIAAGAGITCLMRASIGDIVAAGGADPTLTLLSECAAIAAREGFAPSASAMERSRATFTAAGSTLTASMLRDVERGARTEADHVIGDLLQRNGASPNESRLLRTAYVHLKSYEARRARERAAASVRSSMSASGVHT